MSNKFSIIVILCFVRLIAFSQIFSTKIIVDYKTKQPLEYVNVYSEDKTNSQLSNKKGEFIIYSESTIKTYVFNKTGYTTKYISKSNVLKLDTVFLVEQPVQLNEVEITVKKLEEVVKDKRFYVDDYLVLPNFDFLILTYKINFKGFEVAYYKKDKGVTCSRKFTGEVNEHLFKDCFYNYHLVTNIGSRQFYFTSDSSFDFLPVVRKTLFDSTLSKVVLRIDSQFIYKSERPEITYKGTYFNTSYHSPFLTYVSLYHQKKVDLYTAVYSKEMREMINSEARDSKMREKHSEVIGTKLSRDGTSSTTIRSEVGSSRQSNEASTSFFIETAAGPIYAPMFKKNDTLVVLDFQEDKIVFLTKEGTILKMIPIVGMTKYHHFEAYFDEVKQRFYVTQTQNDVHVIKRLNVYTGIFDRTIPLERPFPKNIQIIDNRMYFQVKEHSWDDTSYIYLQNL